MGDLYLSGVSASAKAVLWGSSVGLGFLLPSSANPITHLSRATTPIKDATPTIGELSDLALTQTRKMTNSSDFSELNLAYAQKQIECSERLGVDLSECNRKGELISQKKSIEKKSTTELTPQQTCANRLEVSLNECNQYGVFINRTPQIASALLKHLATDSWQEVVPKNLMSIKRANFSHQNIDTLKDQDFDGMQLRGIDLSDNNLRTLPTKRLEDLKQLVEINLYGNPLIIPEAFLKYYMNIYFLHNVQVWYNWPTHFDDTVSIELGSSSILASEISNFFLQGTYNNRHSFFPGYKDFHDETYQNLTQNQRAFVCQYLYDALRCETLSNKILCLPANQFDRQTFEFCEKSGSEKLTTTAGIGIVFFGLTLLTLSGLAIGLSAYLIKRHTKDKTPQKEPVTNSTVPTKDLSLDAVDTKF